MWYRNDKEITWVPNIHNKRSIALFYILYVIKLITYIICRPENDYRDPEWSHLAQPGIAIHNPRMARLVEEQKKHMYSIYLCGDGMAHPRRDDRRVGAVRCGDARRDAWRCGALPIYQEHSGLKSYTNLTPYFNSLFHHTFCSISVI